MFDMLFHYIALVSSTFYPLFSPNYWKELHFGTRGVYRPWREVVLEDSRSGRAMVIVGTHALIQDGVGFGSPGLVVIDEQHRFGVEQRRALRDAGGAADTLVMSATPIPRSPQLVVHTMWKRPFGPRMMQGSRMSLPPTIGFSGG